MIQTIGYSFILTVVVGLIILSSTVSRAAGFKIAIIYPKDDSGVSSIGNEATCITEGVFSEAKKAGLDLSFTFFDNDRDAIKTATISRQIADEKFDITIGTTTSTEAIIAAEILNKAKIPFFATTATNPDVTKDKPYSFRLPFDDYQQAHSLADFVGKELKARKVVIVKNLSIPYSTFLSAEFGRHLKMYKNSMIIDEFVIFDGFTKYKNLVNDLVKAKADVIFLPLYTADVAALYNELASRNQKFALLGGDTVGGRKSFFKILNGTSPRIVLIYAKSWAGEPQGPERETFLKLHSKYCVHQDVTLISAAAYDVARLTVRSIKENPESRGAELVKAIKSLNYDGLTGTFRHNDRGEPQKHIFLHKIENNASVFWKRYP